MPIGLYIHVPFCIKKCSYCDFVSYPYNPELAEAYVDALEREMFFHASKMSEEQRILKSVFIGGGTPSCLSGKLLTVIFNNLHKYFQLSPDAEITVECNPGTVDIEKFRELRSAGVNRISMGVQAYQPRLLSALGRVHNWPDVVKAVRLCREAGFDNLSLDLIFGVPGQTMLDWKESLNNTVKLAPEHISAYNLKIEPDTRLQREVASGQLTVCDEELEVEMFLYTIEFLHDHGYSHYEISNFAKTGRESRHNLTYWLNGEYLGLGPAAHSMMNGSRFSNVESVELYIRRLKTGISVIDTTSRLTREEEISETVFLRLRLIEGLDMSYFEQKYGLRFSKHYAKQLEKLTGLGLVEIKGKNLKLTESGLLLANEVFAEFI